MLIVCIVIVIVGLLIILGRQIVKVQKIEQENQMMASYMTSLQGFYSILQGRIEATRKYRHDLSKHIQTLEILMEKSKANTEMQEYVNDLKDRYKVLKGMSYTGNEIIDSILEMKVNTCKKEQINVTINAQGNHFDTWDSIDIVGVLQNLWDNAIEACQRLENESEREIQCSIIQKETCLDIQMKNRIMEDEKITFVTKKKNTYEHGLGMFIIRDLAEKYSGSMTTEIQEQWIMVSVHMGMPNKNKSIGDQ